MTSKYEVVEVPEGNESVHPDLKTPKGARDALQRTINIETSKKGRKLVGCPFRFAGGLCFIVDNGSAAASSARSSGPNWLGARFGGKSKAKNSYKKYMKKTRKRN